MNKYRDKSDYELNLAVAHYLGYKPSLSGNIVTIKQEVKHGCIVYSENFDPCNNPADAMPIIIENRITVAHDILNDEWCAHVGSVMDECNWDYVKEPKIYAHSDNYYRAAMICFLMMKDAENES